MLDALIRFWMGNEGLVEWHYHEEDILELEKEFAETYEVTFI